MNKTTMTVVFAMVAAAAFADVKVSRMFSDSMVLQRGRPVPVRGTADPGENVVVTLGEAKASAKAGADGRFRVVLPAMNADAKGRELKVAGRNEVVFKDVLVGDVWLVSGQSNAEMSFRSGVLKGKETAAEAKDYPNIRAIKFNHEKATFPNRDTPCNKGPWKVVNQWTINDVTAAGYFMAREINAKTGIPVISPRSSRRSWSPATRWQVGARAWPPSARAANTGRRGRSPLSDTGRRSTMR